MSTRIREISNGLRKALLQGESMELSLYKSKLEGHIDEWYEELTADRGDFVFIVTEQAFSVAMITIDKDKNIHINEEAREQLSKIWAKNYIKNLKFLLPKMAEHINEYGLSITGITIKKAPKRAKAIGMGKRV
ncbi:MAG: hypothetical protein DCF19_11430 [Pseudanabaena frigida]|uniref:Uncharacterized protein n=1 Tax=Pseudanabaena frigida TaxID=945775 RepID=A0A2W4WBB2_9CYAN|nr:MAG: hypothetical protein DCF19_11430 [Pseudanabaena frigida]